MSNMMNDEAAPAGRKRGLLLSFSDVAIVAHTIPSERLRPLLTDRLEIPTLPVQDQPRALLVTLCARGDLGGSRDPARRPRLGLALHGACVKWEDWSGIYALQMLVSPAPAAWLLHLAAPAILPGWWREPPARRLPGGEPDLAYRVRSRSGILELDLAGLPDTDQPSPKPPPAQRPDVPTTADSEPGHGAAWEFFEKHPHFYFWLRGRYLWWMPRERQVADLRPATPARLRIPIWQQMGLLSDAEIQTPALCATAPSVTVRWELPRPTIRL